MKAHSVQQTPSFGRPGLIVGRSWAPPNGESNPETGSRVAIMAHPIAESTDDHACCLVCSDEKDLAM